MTLPTPPVPAVLAGVAMAVLASCARQEAPPGGPDDLRPPVVVRTQPEAFATLGDVREVRFEFDERISERVSGGTLDDAITVSPRGGDVRVKHGRRSLTVQMDGGFRPGLVYRVTLNATVSDLFGNRLADPFELVFSTGPAAVPTTIAGEVWSRISGGGEADVRVYATGPGGLIHQASTDRNGIFALRYMPQGSFTVTAFDDVNRDGEIDSTEVQGSIVADITAGDTLLVDIPILAPDTAAAVLVRAGALDSVTVTLEFDDYLDPMIPAEEIDVRLRTEDGGAPAIVGRYQEAAYAAFVEEVADSFARLDSLDAEDAGRAAAAAAPPLPPADSDRAPADTVVIEAPGPIGADPALRGAPRRVPPTSLAPLQGAAPGPTANGRRVLPGRRVVILLDGALTYDVEYQVEVSGVVNINGLTGGGGEVELLRPTPPPDTTAIDTVGGAGVLGDSLSLPDTGAVR